MSNEKKPAATDPLLVSVGHAAAQMSISTRKLWNMTKAGEVPHVRIGRRVMYRPEALRAWLAKLEQTGTAPQTAS